MAEISNLINNFNNLTQNLSELTNKFFSFLDGDFIDQTGELILTNHETIKYSIVRQFLGDDLANQKHQTYIVASFDIGEKISIPNKNYLAQISRQLHKTQKNVPFIIVFRYSVAGTNYLTFTVSELRETLNQKTGNSFVTKVVLLKDINLNDTHRAHTRILEDLGNVSKDGLTFDELHTAWLKVLDTKLLGDNFYAEILEKYNSLVESINLPTQTNPTVENKKDFTLRLVGRLIFCWFLRAKGWIPDELLSTKAIKDDSDYYHEALEPLFFESLNKAPDKRDFNGKEKFESVPYLNGGLFEAKIDDYYRAEKPEYLDRKNFQLEIPNDQIKKLLQLFETYYFTIDENTSQTEEIGVDPEMMGRIFENFILNRSSTGSFYTPREIVDFMVESSLLEGLKNTVKYSNLDTKLFLDLAKEDDHTLTGIAEHYPKRRFITELKQNKIELSVYVMLKVRGWTFRNDKIDRIKHRHKEINYDFWQSFLSQNFTVEEYFFAKPKDIYISNELVKIPKIGLIVDISGLKYVLILSFSTKGFWILDTCYQMFANKVEKLKKEAKASLAEIQGFWSKKNIPQREYEVFEVDGYYHHTHSKRQLSEIFTVFQTLYSQIITKKTDDVKKYFSSPVYDFLEDVYLNTKKSDLDKKKRDVKAYLKSLKILDPACGSGAFPMGVLQKLTEIIHHLEPDKSLYEVKLNLLQNCIYGVDLLPIAVEISRLRCWLSLVVDEDKNDPKLLPNLEFKFVCANSLVGIKQLDNGLGLDEIENKQNELKNLRKQTFEPAQNKQILSQQWENLTTELFNLQTSNGFYDKNATDLAAWNPFENKLAEFFDSQWMFGENEFDLVIGNPPYIQLQKEGGKLGKEFENLGFETFAKTGDIYQLFYEKSIAFLALHGISCFITSNKWMRAGYGEKLRKFFLSKTKPLILFDLGGDVFESATVDSNILICQKR